MQKHFEIIVIGGGHAGIEAAHIASKLGKKTALFTLSKTKIGHLPCNTAIGGTAKGIVVREIDALGGVMGQIADRNIMQMKLLNTSKGASVQCLRAQIDKTTYPKDAQSLLLNLKNLTIKEELITNLLLDNKKIIGIETEKTKYYSDIVILTTGTYMSSITLKGEHRKKEGPDGQITTNGISLFLKNNNFKLIRLKTGTPPRLKDETINYSDLKIAPGSKEKLSFSFWKQSPINSEQYIDCYITRTTLKTKQIILENLDKSPIYSGKTNVTGPRYCPSIEEKIVRFTERDTHQLFLEKEARDSNSVYVQGFSSSLPEAVQAKMIKTIPGLENAEALKWGYAIEYDAIYPTQLKRSLETKLIENLFSAGQVNGTSGYEEAAAQGLIAGINAVQKINKEEPLHLNRDEAYIGVLIDDLITKGTNEPYRLLTSSAEYRLILRNDNADQRLYKKAFKYKTISKQQFIKVEKKVKKINEVIEHCKNKIITPTDWKKYEQKLVVLKNKKSLHDILKMNLVNSEKILKKENLSLSNELMSIISTLIKYEGYLIKQDKLIKEWKKNEQKKISQHFDYAACINLSKEIKNRLIKIQPETIGQASRIQGVSPADILNIMYELKKYNEKV